jgi:hypothetical protein
MFLDSGAGAFGTMRRVWLWDDQAATEVARRMLTSFSGVDIWRDGHRVALVQRATLRLAS